MKKKLEYSPVSDQFQAIKEINYQFVLWHYEQTTKQIQYILGLTGAIYMMMGIVNLLTFSSDIYNILIFIQLFLIPIYAFFISYLAYKKVTFSILETLLFLAPILTALIHAFIFSNMTEYSSYQTELYLMIFWTLTVSGLRLEKAIIASICVFIIGEVYPYLFFDNQGTPFVLHTMWMSISILFGIVGGVLIHRSRKDTFKKELELQRLATVDTLTGLYNRVKFDSILTQELSRAKRYNFHIGILMLDIDYFKNVNDAYGHLIGDEILIGIANNVKSSIRSSDYLFRWGGEEFVIICLETDQNDIVTFAEKIRLNVAQQNFDKVGNKTISIGATMNNYDDTVESIIQRADESLYKAKETGRNKVCYQ